MARSDDHTERRELDAPWRATSERQIDLFCDRARADPSLQARLRQCDELEQFIGLATIAARDCGLALGPDDVRAAMRVRLPGSDGLLDSADRETDLPPQGWLPSGTFWRDGRLFVQWTFFGEERLTEPFFEGSVQRRMSKPFNRFIRYATSIDKLAEWLRRHPPLPPSGFIFHMSRCGSTLVAQMLAALSHNIVVSEASPIDAVVRARHWRPDLSDDTQAAWLTWVIGALGQARAGERNYFIKLDCWHTAQLPLFARAFPDVPWIFLYRDPVEVLVSQLRMPGIHMIPGMLAASLFAIEPTESARGPENYRARVLAQLCAPVLAHYGNGKSLLINYRQLPQALWTKILPHFGIECVEQDRSLMAATARYDAKTPNFEFTPDTEAKQREATALIRNAANERLGEIYQRLEELRINA
jgi:hypothetical protein